MNRPKAEKSSAGEGEGINEPDKVHPIADEAQNPDQIGFMYEGEEYGEDAWIICDTEDLITEES